MRAPEYPELRGHRLGAETQAEGKRGGGLWLGWPLSPCVWHLCRAQREREAISQGQEEDSINRAGQWGLSKNHKERVSEWGRALSRFTLMFRVQATHVLSPHPTSQAVTAHSPFKRALMLPMRTGRVVGERGQGA